MHDCLSITQIKGFAFCPRSIYFGNIHRENYLSWTYHGTPQRVGLAAHKAIDDGTYSSRKDVLQGMAVYSEKYRLIGKIDTLDLSSGTLRERKKLMSKLYDGLRYQLYAQCFALREMGYGVRAMEIYSKEDNKIHSVAMPGRDGILEFEALLERIRSFSFDDPFIPNPRKCAGCVYSPLCDCHEEESEDDVIS